jgi:hypothetical protein
MTASKLYVDSKAWGKEVIVFQAASWKVFSCLDKFEDVKMVYPIQREKLRVRIIPSGVYPGTELVELGNGNPWHATGRPHLILRFRAVVCIPRDHNITSHVTMTTPKHAKRIVHATLTVHATLIAVWVSSSSTSPA